MAIKLMSLCAQSFTQGQSVYVAAVKTSGSPDLATERKIKGEFEKQKRFKISPSIETADFVFLMIVEYEFNQSFISGSEDVKGANAYVVKPEDYLKNRNDLDGIRAGALWEYGENNGIWRGGGLPKKIVKKFHDSKK